MITPVFVPASHRWIIFLSYMLCFLYAYYVLMHLPVIDFRPYKVGNNIPELRDIPEGAATDVFEYHWKFNVEGEEEVVVTDGSYPQHEGEFIEVDTKMIKEGYVPPIHDFQILDDGEDITAEILEADKVLLIVAYDLNLTEKQGYEAIKSLEREAKSKGYEVLGLTASGDVLKSQIKEEFGLDFPFYQTDATALKTVVRANPGILVLEQGTITQKKHYSDASSIKL